MTGNEPTFWIFTATVALTVVAGLAATRVRSEWVSTLPMAHVAGLVLVALFGWEALVYLPGTIQVYTAGVAGIPDPAGVEAYQAFAIASAVFVIAAALAVYGLLRRRPWALVLGVGVAATRVAMTATTAVNLWSLDPDPFGPSAVAWNTLSLIAERGVPAVAAIALLLWPLARGSTAEPAPADAVEWSGEPSPEAGR